MQIINQDSEGKKLYINFGFDVSSATAFTMEMQPKVGGSVNVTPTLETSNTWVTDKQLIANEFVSYTTTADMFSDYTGKWRMKATATVGSRLYSTELEDFMVSA